MIYSQKTQLMMALCLPLLMAPAWAADSFRLDSVDFISVDGRTHIIMHTGSILPYQKVLVSGSKLVLDIDRVDADESVRTNFSGAANVSHVILKPLDAHRVRLIIRGENLGAPVVAFNSPVAHDVGLSPALPEETRAGLDRLQEEGMQDAALTAEDADMASAVPDEQPLMAEDEPVFTPEESLPPAPAASAPPARSAPAPIVDLGAGSEAGGGNSVSRFFEAAAEGKFNPWIPCGLLVLLLAGAGAFIRRKLMSLQADVPQLEDLMAEQAGGRKVGFREMANAYRQQDDVRKTLAGKPRPALNVGKQAPATRPQGRQAGREELIGLRSLNKASAPRGQAARQAAYLESLLASASEPPKPVQAPAPKKQVVNQYLKNQAPPARPKAPKAPPAADARMAQDMKRLQEVQQAVQQTVARRPKPGVSSPQSPINRAPAAAKFGPASSPRASRSAAQAGADLPAGQNQEVLNFLRNVAELMEKDGRPEVARNIQRNLNSI